MLKTPPASTHHLRQRGSCAGGSPPAAREWRSRRWAARSALRSVVVSIIFRGALRTGPRGMRYCCPSPPSRRRGRMNIANAEGAAEPFVVRVLPECAAEGAKAGEGDDRTGPRRRASPHAPGCAPRPGTAGNRPRSCRAALSVRRWRRVSRSDMCRGLSVARRRGGQASSSSHVVLGAVTDPERHQHAGTDADEEPDEALRHRGRHPLHETERHRGSTSARSSSSY